jgi:hypothetical protein
MAEVIVFCEGQTEEKFIKQIVAPSLRQSGIHLKPQTLKTSQDGSGGAVTFDRLKFYARNALRQKNAPILATFLDLYALDTDFPCFIEARRLPEVYSRVAMLETELHKAIVGYVACRPERFLPHIQPYEFEGLLFSDVDALTSVEPGWSRSLRRLTEVVDSHESPEHINDGFDTKPSRRLETTLDPGYHKTRHGPLAAERITLAVMEEKCRHFRGWMTRLRALG